MEQLHCEFLFKPSDEFSELEIEEWSMDYDDIDKFLNHIETLQELRVPLNSKLIKLEIYQEEV